jgi:hypothetical protein
MCAIAIRSLFALYGMLMLKKNIGWLDRHEIDRMLAGDEIECFKRRQANIVSMLCMDFFSMPVRV